MYVLLFTSASDDGLFLYFRKKSVGIFLHFKETFLVHFPVDFLSICQMYRLVKINLVKQNKGAMVCVCSI